MPGRDDWEEYRDSDDRRDDEDRYVGLIRLVAGLVMSLSLLVVTIAAVIDVSHRVDAVFVGLLIGGLLALAGTELPRWWRS